MNLSIFHIHVHARTTILFSTVNQYKYDNIPTFVIIQGRVDLSRKTRACTAFCQHVYRTSSSSKNFIIEYYDTLITRHGFGANLHVIKMWNIVFCTRHIFGLRDQTSVKLKPTYEDVLKYIVCKMDVVVFGHKVVNTSEMKTEDNNKDRGCVYGTWLHKVLSIEKL